MRLAVSQLAKDKRPQSQNASEICEGKMGDSTPQKDCSESDLQIR